MARVRIEFDLDEDYVDSAAPSGLTDEAQERISEFAITMGTELDFTLVSGA